MKDDEIEKLSKLDGSQINEAKIILANEATKMLHGEVASKNAMETSKKTFEEKSFDKNLPTLEIKKNKLKEGLSLKDTLIKIGYATSNSDFKRNFKNAAYKINNKNVDNENQLLSLDDLDKDIIKISFGKKKHYLIKVI